MSDQIDDSTFAAQPPAEAAFEQMVKRAQADDHAAMIAFIQHFEGIIRGYVRKHIGNDDIADDVYHEVVYKVCKALPHTNEGLQLQGVAKKWMFKIATNLICDYFEACKRLQIVSLEYLEQRFQAGDANVAKDWYAIEQLSMQGADEIVCDREETNARQRLVIGALGQLSGQLRNCFYMRDVKGLSHQEIAHTLQISEAAARSYASRGRQAFIKAVAQLQAQQEGRK